MPILYVLFLCFLFGRVFWYLQVRYLILIPTSFALYFLSQTLRAHQTPHSLQQLIKEHTLSISWIIVNIGLYGTGLSMGRESRFMSLFILLLNGGGRIGAYMTNYGDGKHFFSRGYRTGCALLLIDFSATKSIGIFINAIGMIGALTLSIQAFIAFIIGSLKPIQQEIYYDLRMMFHIMILLTAHKLIGGTTASGIVIGQIYVLSTAIAIFLLQKKAKKPSIIRMLTAEDILKGKKVTDSNSDSLVFQNNESWKPIFDFVENIPRATQIQFGWLNTVLTLILIIAFFVNVRLEDLNFQTHLIYRGGIIVFLLSTQRMKKIHCSIPEQRAMIFMVIYAAAYLSIRGATGGDKESFVFLATMRNIFNQFALFYINEFARTPFLVRQDFLYRVGTNVGSLSLNVVLLTTLDIQGSLLFSLIFLYVGFQIFLLLHNIKYINERYPNEKLSLS